MDQGQRHLESGRGVEARVIKADKVKRRIGLSIKAANYTPMKQNGDYQVWVCSEPDGTPLDNEFGVITLQHGQIYSLTLFNNVDLRCDIQLKIDGKHVGAWRIPAEDAITVKRPVHNDGCFTFFRLGTPEAESAGISADSSAGWIEAKFIPETRVKGKLFGSPSALYAAKPTAEGEENAGGTGYTGKSQQKFRDADDIFSFNEAAAVTVKLQIKCSTIATPEFSDFEISIFKEALASIPSEENFQKAVNTLAAKIKAERETDDYLMPEHFEKMDQLVDLKLDFRQFRLQEWLAAYIHRDAANHAEYEVLPAIVFACPDCKKDSKVPKGAGHIRIKCPHCACQFIRKA